MDFHILEVKKWASLMKMSTTLRGSTSVLALSFLSIVASYFVVVFPSTTTIDSLI